MSGESMCVGGGRGGMSTYVRRKRANEIVGGPWVHESGPYNPQPLSPPNREQSCVQRIEISAAGPFYLPILTRTYSLSGSQGKTHDAKPMHRTGECDGIHF